MKAVILAAGVGKRMRPLTLTTPKTLLKINGKPIINYVFESLPPTIDEVIVVVKYLGNQIKKYIGTKFRGLKVLYVAGSDKGSAYSLLTVKNYLNNERFLLVYGDEIPDPIDVKNCLANDLSILVFPSHNPHAHGIAQVRKNGTIGKIVEKPQNPPSNLAVDGVMVLHTDIFTYTLPASGTEFHLSAMIGLFCRDHTVHAVPAKNFIGDLTTPDDIVRVENILKQEGENSHTPM